MRFFLDLTDDGKEDDVFLLLARSTKSVRSRTDSFIMMQYSIYNGSRVDSGDWWTKVVFYDCKNEATWLAEEVSGGAIVLLFPMMREA